MPPDEVTTQPSPPHGLSLEEFAAKSKKAQEKPPVVVESVSYDDFMGTEYPPTSYLVDKLLTTDGVNMISGHPKSGKTWMTLEFIIKIATGGKVFGYFETGEPKSCLLLNEEDTPANLQSHIRLMTQEKGLPIHVLSRKGYKVDDAETTTAIVSHAVSLGIDLIVIDNLTLVHSLKENDADEIKKIFVQLRRFNEAGITVLVLHHHRKGDGKSASSAFDIRGSVSIFASLDNHLIIERLPDPQKFAVVIKQEKNKSDTEVPPFTVVLNTEGGYSWNYVGVSDESVPVSMRAQNDIHKFFVNSDEGFFMSRKDAIARFSNYGENTVIEAMKYLVARGMLKEDTRKKLGLLGSPLEKVYSRVPDASRTPNLFDDLDPMYAQ